MKFPFTALLERRFLLVSELLDMRPQFTSLEPRMLWEILRKKNGRCVKRRSVTILTPSKIKIGKIKRKSYNIHIN